MKISVDWLQGYFDEKLPTPEELVEILTFHAFEIDGLEEIQGDHVLDVDVLPNRAHDCLCHRGIAKELSVLLEKPLKKDPLKEELPATYQSKEFSAYIEDTTLCRRFTGAVIKGVAVGASPDWLVKRLEALGQKSINNVVDATNYVMFDLGQPLHAFDAGKLTQGKDKWNIVVRVGKSREEVTTLDGEKYEVGSNNLLITDGTTGNAIGIAGVKGGKHAEVNEETTELIIESANFHPVSVRKTSQQLKLRTDASTRFENELSPDLAIRGLIASVKLIEELTGGKLEGYVDEYPRPKTHPYKTGVSLVEVNQLLGTEMKDKDVEEILKRFDFAYEKINPIGKVLELAQGQVGKSYKYGASISYDAPNEFDCSSFVSYLFSQGGISVPRMAIDQYVFGDEIKESDLRPGDIVFSRNSNPEDHTFTRISDGAEVTHAGAKNTSEEFMPGTKVESGISHNGIYLGDGKVIHAAPGEGVVIEELAGTDKFKKVVGYRRMTEDKERYVVEIPFERMDLLIPEDLIEEIGRVYGYKNIKAKQLPKSNETPEINKAQFYADTVRDVLVEMGFSEVYTYALGDRGEVEIANPIASDKKLLRSMLRNSLEEALELNEYNVDLLGVSHVRIFEIGKVFANEKEHTSLALGVRARSKDGKNKEKDILEEGLGAVSQELGIEISTDARGGVVELDFDKLVEKLPEPKNYEEFKKPDTDINYQSISPYPFVLRDIAVWTPKEILQEELQETIKENSNLLLTRSTLFDKYFKDDRVSYAFRLVFQSNEKTLSDKEINKIMDSITKAIERKGWRVR